MLALPVLLLCTCQDYIVFLYVIFEGLNLLKLAAHLKEKAAQLRCKGLGCIKIALAVTDTSSLLEILEGHFGHVNLYTSILTTCTEKSKEKVTTKGKTAYVPKKYQPLLMLVD